MKEKIIDLIKQMGPIVPTDISSKLDSNSYLVSAILSELVREGVIFYSHKKMTTSPLYYLKGQEDLVRKRLFEILKIPEKKILEFFNNNKLASKESLEPQQRYMVDELNDFIKVIKLKINGEDKIFYRHHSITEEQVIERFNNWIKNKDSEKIQSVKKNDNDLKVDKSVKEKKKQIDEDVVEENSLFDKLDSSCKKFINENNFELIECDVVKKKKEFNIIVKQNFGVGQTFFVKYFKKSRINDSDISKAFTIAVTKQMPCIILSKAKLSKKAQNLIMTLGYLINVIKC